jgi:hypothetical protein
LVAAFLPADAPVFLPVFFTDFSKAISFMFFP